MYLVELDDVWVPDLLEDVDFARNSFNVSDFFDPMLLEDLYGDFLPSEDVGGLLDFSEGAFADRASHDIMPDYASLRSLGHFLLLDFNLLSLLTTL